MSSDSSSDEKDELVDFVIDFDMVDESIQSPRGRRRPGGMAHLMPPHRGSMKTMFAKSSRNDSAAPSFSLQMPSEKLTRSTGERKKVSIVRRSGPF